MKWTFLRNMFGCVTEKKRTDIVEEDNKHLPKEWPKFVRTFVDEDIYKPTRCSGGFWDVFDINENEPHLLQKIYKYIIDSKEVLYFTWRQGVMMLIWTERFGYCRVNINYDMNFMEFCIPKLGDRYDILYEGIISKCPDLHHLMKYITELGWKEYSYDKNL